MGRELIGTWVAEQARLTISEREGSVHAEQFWPGQKTPVMRAAFAGTDLTRLQLFDWKEAVPVRLERGSDGKVTALTFRDQRYRRE
jgi:hypothetical protein